MNTNDAGMFGSLSLKPNPNPESLEGGGGGAKDIFPTSINSF